MIQKYGLKYWLWAHIEDKTNYWGWTSELNKLAMRKMNKISQEKFGKDIFSV